MSTTVQWLVGVAAGLTALGVIWRKAVRPVIKGVSAVAEATPVLLEIAAEYKPNGNGSLHDILDRVERRGADVAEKLDSHVADMGVLSGDVAKHIAADSKAFAEIAAVSAAQTLAVETTLEIAAALKGDTAAIAAVVKADAEETAAALHTETETIADALAKGGPPPGRLDPRDPA